MNRFCLVDLFIVNNYKLFSIKKSARNLTGVDIVTPDQINIEYLAPGGDAGRLTIFTKSALKTIGGAK